MGEVGDQGPEFHAEVGAYAAERGIESLYTLGDLCVHASQAFGSARHFDDMDSLLAEVTPHIGDFQSVVVKGSRFMKMERVVEALLSQGAVHNSTPTHHKGEAHVA
jgi:UDP-N-acetylmuramoyl-tripeptide--D-alanyl-D-alanine ligase